MSQLSSISKLNGFTMKQLSEATGIKYTTLMTIAKQPYETWQFSTKSDISLALDMTESNLKRAMEGEILAPFIKWVGGKRQLLPQLVEFLPTNYDKYFEPFIGGGAFLLRLAPKKAVINDFNPELYNTWKVVRDDLVGLTNLLLQHQENDTKEYYLQLRSADRDGRIVTMSDTERAARFIYLNKAGYNGLWRVNSKGQNNVPYGSHKSLNLVPQTLKSVSNYLNNNEITILNGDYKNALIGAKRDDFVYFNPPYIPVSPTASFTTYTTNSFGLVQQEQLRDTALGLSEKGVKVMLSNADVPLAQKLYGEKFNIHHVTAKRFINSKGNKRGPVGEIIITNY